MLCKTCFKCQKWGYFDCVSVQCGLSRYTARNTWMKNCSWTQYRPMGRKHGLLRFRSSIQESSSSWTLVLRSQLSLWSHKAWQAYGTWAASKILHGPGNQALSVAGQFDAKLAYKEKQSHQTISVVKGLKTNLLGIPALHALKLTAWVDSVEQYEDTIHQKYPKLFTGLGNMCVEYKAKCKTVCPVLTQEHSLSSANHRPKRSSSRS